MQPVGGRLHPIAYGSRTQKNYSHRGRGTSHCAGTQAFQRRYILPYTCTVRTDHLPVVGLFHNPTGKSARWSLTIQDFNPN